MAGVAEAADQVVVAGAGNVPVPQVGGFCAGHAARCEAVGPLRQRHVVGVYAVHVAHGPVGHACEDSAGY